jgi:dihydrofolate reductase
MRKLVYSTGVSLDGYITDPDGEIDWTVPDEELFRFHTERVRETGLQLCGRRLYETMLYWESSDRDPTLPEHEAEFARLWQALPKIVHSRTLASVQGNCTLVREIDAEAIADLVSEPGKDIAVGGATLAGEMLARGLVDELLLFVYPVVLGGGTPWLAPAGARIELELLENRVFGSRVLYLRYSVNGRRRT